MLAVDTNILVRYLTRDDRAQSQRARKLLNEDQIYIAKTVLLETEWVLRSGYKFPPMAIQQALTGLMGLDNLIVEDALVAEQALTWFGAGMDFADAMHLASCEEASEFISFDTKFINKAKKLGVESIRTP